MLHSDFDISPPSHFPNTFLDGRNWTPQPITSFYCWPAILQEKIGRDYLLGSSCNKKTVPKPIGSHNSLAVQTVNAEVHSCSCQKNGVLSFSAGTNSPVMEAEIPSMQALIQPACGWANLPLLRKRESTLHSGIVWSPDLVWER